MPDAHSARTYPAHDEHPMEKVTVAVDPYDVEYKANILRSNTAIMDSCRYFSL